MAKNGAGEREVLLMFMFLLLCSCCTGDEYDLLLSIKNLMNDPLNQSLSNWNLSLSYCEWKGIACDNSSHVAKIELSGNNLSGKIPESFFHFPYIETIDLSDNQLSGGIPSNISSCLSLRHLNLSNNNFTGPLPRGSIPQLQALDLSNNMLSGQIPDEIGFFWGLEFLDLGGNDLVGKIPKSISNMTGLQILTLSSNQLIGEIPQELGLLKSLTWIYLGYNNLSGGIPTEIGELTSLNHLDLVSNNLTGEIPSSFGNLTSLHYLFLYLNKLTGPVPPSIFGLQNLISLDLSDNFLSGEIPELIIQLQNLEVLHLFSNNFTGKIPNSVASLPRLQVLQLWSNNFSGEIPKNLGRDNNLTVLDLSTNTLVGKIPGTLCNSGCLYKLILFSNSLTGEIPNSLSRCSSLRRIRLQNNRLSGELPHGFTKLSLVYFLDLSNNHLSGTMGGTRGWEMPELQMLNFARNRFSGALPASFGSGVIENLDLSANGLSGEIPASFGDFSELMELKLSENKLSGEIPDELSLCEKLVSLNLSHNQLSGRIPTSLTQMPVLGQLDLSVNQFSGEIPKSLGEVESLIQVNISHNHFHGNLPSTGAFLAINSSAVSGNRLCGGDSTAGLPPCKGDKLQVWLLIVTCLLVALAALVVLSLILVFVRKRNDNFETRGNNEVDGVWELEFFDSKASKELRIIDVVASMRDENVISRGIARGGVLYKGKSSVSEFEFVMKEVSGIDSLPTGFWTELGKLKHPNIEKVIGVMRSKKCGFWVSEFVEGQSVSEVFRGMSWDRRRKVALGIAKALCYLHCKSTGSSVGFELSPEKIIVDGKDEPRLRLRSPGRICTDAKTFVSSPYVAPETREAKDTTEKSDIYVFGLILIELLTGKTPADTEFGLQESIVEWARYCYSDCHLDTWVDPTVKGTALSNHQNEIVETMSLALYCTADDPMARPCASDVVKTLESVIRPTYCVFGLNCSSTI
ncbi:hypothetical protein RHSIM_Rhsim02G0176500 [Rhododendron simsii]|uniref:Protein kinase domain-containing protein n=1 Tax=Rhododendron simsii TaxID=118357 RepID=A0A834HG53_RHOSS|nr:hypothetical protein RHSIM_Rhsim02G0176500 [Rhododendron simsii]